MSTQFSLWHLRRLNALTSQIIPHSNQYLLPDSNHSSVNEPHRKECDDCCRGESCYQHLHRLGHKGVRTLDRKSNANWWTWYHSRYLQGRLAVSISPLDRRNLTHLQRIQRSAIHQPRFQDFSRKERTCLGRPRTNAKQNFQKANPHTARTTVDMCLSISSLFETEGRLTLG